MSDRPGIPAPSPTAATATATRTRERAPRGRVEYTGTPGETATPQTTYIPPPDAGRRRSRRGSTRGGKRTGDGKGGLKGERYVTVQLPDDPAGESKGEGKMGTTKGGRSRANVPGRSMPASTPSITKLKFAGIERPFMSRARQ